MWTGVPYKWWLCNLPGIVSWQLLSEHQVSFCCSLALNYRIEESAERCGELELQKELVPSTLLSPASYSKPLKTLDVLRIWFTSEKGLCCHPALWHFTGRCLLGVLGTVLSCVPYAERLVPRLEEHVFPNWKGYLNTGKTCLNKHLLIQIQFFPKKQC